MVLGQHDVAFDFSPEAVGSFLNLFRHGFPHFRDASSNVSTIFAVEASARRACLKQHAGLIPFSHRLRAVCQRVRST